MNITEVKQSNPDWTIEQREETIVCKSGEIIIFLSLFEADGEVLHGVADVGFKQQHLESIVFNHMNAVDLWIIVGRAFTNAHMRVVGITKAYFDRSL